MGAIAGIALVAAAFGGATETCASRSQAAFPGAFTRPGNLVVGPLALSGGAYGEVDWRDGHRVVTFTACERRRTFWSGFVFARSPRCVPLRVWVDDEPRPRRAGLQLGRRC